MRLKDIAKIADVSIATVSRVINGKTSELSEVTVRKVEKVLEENNYVPNAVARAMKTNRTHMIGLIIPDVRNPFFTELARGAEDAAYKLGYSLFLCNTDDDYEKEIKYLYSLHEIRSDGIVIAGSFERDKDAEQSHKFNVPMVAIDREVHYKNIQTFITIDNYQSSKELVEKLYKQGYRNFLYIGGPKEASVTLERYNGTLAGLKDKGDVTINASFGKFIIEYGFDAITKIEDIEQYDMVICGNDLIAIGVANGLQTMGVKIPDEIGVSGFDDIDLASSFNPMLTTVRQPTYEMGEFAIKTLDRIIRKEEFEEGYVMDQKLVFRNSTQ